MCQPSQSIATTSNKSSQKNITENKSTENPSGMTEQKGRFEVSDSSDNNSNKTEKGDPKGSCESNNSSCTTSINDDGSSHINEESHSTNDVIEEEVEYEMVKYCPSFEVNEKLIPPTHNINTFMDKHRYLVGVQDVYKVIVNTRALRFFMNADAILDELPRHTSSLLPPQPEGQTRPTLVLDMDETLIHANCQTIDKDLVKAHGITDEELLVAGSLNWDYTFIVPGTNVLANIKKRPHVDTFLEKMAEVFEVVVWTAGERRYADEILNRMDPEGKLISHRLYRNHCTMVNIESGAYVKDLDALGRNIDSVVILENSPRNFMFHINNGIPIKDFEAILKSDEGSSDPNGLYFEEDNALEGVCRLLQYLAGIGDQFQNHLAHWFKLNDLHKSIKEEYETTYGLIEPDGASGLGLEPSPSCNSDATSVYDTHSAEPTPQPLHSEKIPPQAEYLGSDVHSDFEVCSPALTPNDSEESSTLSSAYDGNSGTLPCGRIASKSLDQHYADEFSRVNDMIDECLEDQHFADEFSRVNAMIDRCFESNYSDKWNQMGGLACQNNDPAICTSAEVQNNFVGTY